MDFHTYLHAVGTGHKGNRDLSFEESHNMMRQLLDQKAYPEQIAAFLLGWRMKPETTEEFRGALHACDAYTRTTPIANSLELGYPFDGKRHNPYLFPLTASLLQKRLNLIVTGDILQPAKKGITTQDICRHIPLTSNLYYFERQTYCPSLHALSKIRNRLDLRTGLNTIEKLPRVAQSDAAVTGVFHKPYVKKYIDIFAARYKRFALLQGNEGTPELFSKGRLWLVVDAKVQEYLIDPKRYGIDYQRSWKRISLETSLEQLNDPSEVFHKLARLNAAILLMVADHSTDIDEAFAQLA